MSKANTKDQYGPLLGTPTTINTIRNTIRPPAPTTPLLAPRPRQPSMTPTMASIVKSPISSNLPQYENNPLIKSSNRFTTLQYQNTLRGPRGFTTQPSSSAQTKIDNTYIEKYEDLPIMTIENSWYQTNSPKQLTQTLFPLDFHYVPHNTQKTHIYYEFLLVDTDSAEIFHNKDQDGKILFSKLKINKVIHPQEWDNPYTKKNPFQEFLTHRPLPIMTILLHGLMYYS